MNSKVLQPLKVVLRLIIAGFVAFADNSPVSAQLTPDNTLGAENTIVTPQQLRDLIQGGAIRGNALFHSFDEFNVGSDRGVFFDLQNNTDILNVFTRVTGGNVSNILGTLGILQDALNSNVLGNANLFLLNPNGITFGANANLQLNGSFFATTADGFGFDNFTFSASGEEAPPPLLTVSIPRFASFRGNPGDIAVNQSNLTVNQGQNISLVGGNVSVAGSGDINNLQGSLTAPGGRIELGGLTVAETVNINPDLSLVFPDGVARGDVSLTDAATLSVVSDTAGLNGGSVGINARNLSIIEDSAILAGIGAGFGGEGVTAGDIDLNATGGITISDSFSEDTLPPGALTEGRGVQNRVNRGATGTGGNVNVTADSLSITNGGFISISTFGIGDAGDINVNVAGELAIDGGNETSTSRLSNVVFSTAVGDSGDIILNADSVSLSNTAILNTAVFAPTFDEDGVQTAPGGVGNGGNVQITTNTLDINSGAFISTDTVGVGNAGDIQITTNILDINSGAFISTDTSGVGNAGNVLIDATGNVTIDGEIGDSGSTIFSNVNAGAVGDAGDIIINAGSFSLIDGAQIQTGPFAEGEGNAGDVVINVMGDVTIRGRGANGLPSGIFNNVESGVIGNAGNVTIQAGGNVTFNDGAINSNIAPGAEGDAGDITINATSLSLLDGSQLQTLIQGDNGDTPGGIGNAGNIGINVTGNVAISGLNANESPSGIFNAVEEGGIGDAGNITITGNSIFIDNGSLDSRNFSSGNAGNITLNASDTVSITSGSFINTAGKLGNISIGNPLDGDTTFTPTEVIIDSSFLSSGNSIVTAPEFDNLEIDAGNISIFATERISLSDSQSLGSRGTTTSTSRLGNAGNTILQTLDNGQITFDNISISSLVNNLVQDEGTLRGIGNAGTVEIITGSLDITNSFIGSSTFGDGDAGLITINASESVSLTQIEGGTNTFISNQIAETSIGNGADIIINTPSLSLSDADIITGTQAQGNAGNININAPDSINLNNNSSVITDTFSQGSAGNININTTSLSLSNNSLLRARTFGQGNAGDITVQTDSLNLNSGAQINSSTSGVGNAGNIFIDATGDVTIDGSISPGSGNAIFSNVNAGATGNAGDITINAGSLNLLNSAQLLTIVNGATDTLPAGDGDAGDVTIDVTGDVNITGRGVRDSDGANFQSAIFTRINQGATGNAGNVTIEADGNFTIDDGFITSVLSTNAVGSAGDIAIDARSLSLTNNAQISASTFGQGNAGTVTLDVGDLVSLDENSFIASVVNGAGVGNAGDIEIDARSLSLTNSARISSSTFGQGNADAITLDVTDLILLDNLSIIDSQVGNGGQGNAGGISIESGSLEISNSSLIISSTSGVGNAEDISITVNDSISISGRSSIRANVERGGNGIAGNVDIQTDSLTLRSGGQIQASVFRTSGDTPGGIGQSGNITINAEEFVDISGIGETGFSSGILVGAGRESRSLTGETQTAGNIEITTGDFRIADGAGVGATTNSDDFNGGNITITANDFSATGGGQIVSTTRGAGDAGNIKLNVSDSITISGSDPNFQDRINLVTEQIANTTDTLSDVIANQGAASGIFANTEVGSTGAGGSINIDPEIITVEDGGAISVDSQGTGIGGTLDITSDVVLLRNGNGTPLISADSQSDGGNITINTTALVALPGENSDITANSVGGLGGRIIINADNVLGIQAQEELTEGNDITVISGLGSQFSGQVTLNTPQTNPQQENIEAPEEVVDSSDIITQSACYDFGGDSQLANTGRGGVPQIPGFITRNDVVNVDLVDEVLPEPPPEAIKPHHRTDVTFLDSNGEKFKPAMGAVLLPNGMVEFVDYNPAEVYRDMYAAAGCSR